MQNGDPVIYNTKRFRSAYEAWGKNLMVCASFNTKEGEQIVVKTAVSAVSTSGAKLNMGELDNLSFEELHKKEKHFGKKN